MTLHLLLIRHAKAEPHSNSGRDFDRALNAKGQRQAEGLNAWLMQRMQNDIPADWAARHSPALRTRQTSETILRGLDTIERQADDRIWNANTVDLTEVIRACIPHTNRVLLVGHNPGLEQLVYQLTAQLRPMATGSVTEIVCGDDFSQARLIGQFRPEID